MGNNFGQRIKQARLAKGMTQEELGKLLGVEKSAVAKYENGRIVNLKQTTMQKISAILDIPASDMILCEDDFTQTQMQTINITQQSQSPEIAIQRTDSRKTFSTNLRFHIGNSGKTQKEISEAVGVSDSTFSDWCTGKKYPRIEKIEALANYFGITVTELVGTQKEVVQQGKEEIISTLLRLHTDTEFLKIVEKISKLDSNKLKALEQFLMAFND